MKTLILAHKFSLMNPKVGTGSSDSPFLTPMEKRKTIELAPEKSVFFTTEGCHRNLFFYSTDPKLKA